ncbi:MAG: aspartate aminotransferase family protein [Rhodospirillaceae bacterium]|jgi:acetylornithine/N-succinyldiaminopimelate aminotransferase|nr:aspartate aminotransferase family protein [Rhodospirillaceae bacterium]
MPTQAVMPTYARTDLVFEYGEGAWLVTDHGRRFLDFTSGIAVNALGHAHPHLVAALQEQAGKFWHCSNLYRIDGQERLAQRLVEASFADTVFFCNSGAEALECAIKTARRYHQAAGRPQKYRVITADNSFHGRTLATIAAGGQAKHLDGFGPAVDAFDHVPFGNLNEARVAVTDETAAILVEPVQGEGGIFVADDEYLKGLRAMADEFGLLLIFDEVQCGMGRTGSLFAYEHAGITPDIMTLAKALGGGFPVGACLATAEAAEHMVPGTHGSTFGGNPLAMAAANAVLDVLFEDGFLEQVGGASERLVAGLEKLVAQHTAVFEGVRGRGLMIGLKCKVANGDLVARLLEEDMLTVVAGDNVLRLLPPLNVADAEVDLALEKLDVAAQSMAG